MDSGESDNEVWEKLITQQHDIFRRTVDRNRELEAKVKELDRELNVWKTVFVNKEQENDVLKREVLELGRSLSSMKDDNAMVLCLIDGDGCIFSSDLLSQGQAGGRQAAQVLTKGITDYMTINGQGRAQILAIVYMNKQGLAETLNSHSVCTPAQFDSFLNGFNQASPLFHIVDVGSGKEAADAKLRDCMRLFSRFPQTTKIFFGGSHDNGYVSALASLQNEGFLDKVVVLQGYKQMASEYKGFNLATTEFPGLFRSVKIPPNKRNIGAMGTPIVTLPELSDGQSPRINATGAALPSVTLASTKTKAQGPATGKNQKFRTTPCNFYYITSNCRHGANCSYSHDLKLTPEKLAEIRAGAKLTPCAHANKGKVCKDGDQCPHGHSCPRGPTCPQKGKGCKFIWTDMHNQSNKQTQSHKRGQSATNSSRSEVSTPLSVASLSFLPNWDSNRGLPSQNELYNRYFQPSQ